MITLTVLGILFVSIVIVLQIVIAVAVGFVGIVGAIISGITGGARNARTKGDKTIIVVEEQKHGLSNEEILAIGAHPDNEAYKMSLIAQILGK